MARRTDPRLSAARRLYFAELRRALDGADKLFGLALDKKGAHPELPAVRDRLRRVRAELRRVAASEQSETDEAPAGARQSSSSSSSSNGSRSA